jgi:hypothetical protein
MSDLLHKTLAKYLNVDFYLLSFFIERLYSLVTDNNLVWKLVYHHKKQKKNFPKKNFCHF